VYDYVCVGAGSRVCVVAERLYGTGGVGGAGGGGAAERHGDPHSAAFGTLFQDPVGLGIDSEPETGLGGRRGPLTGAGCGRLSSMNSRV